MYAANDDQDCVFMECSMNLNRQPHMVIDCIPLDRELGDSAPIYFKVRTDSVPNSLDSTRFSKG